MDIEQYVIVHVNLDPTIGSEIKKTRLCVIISPNEMNKYLNTIVLAPMTTNLKTYPTRVSVKHNGKKMLPHYFRNIHNSYQHPLLYSEFIPLQMESTFPEAPILGCRKSFGNPNLVTGKHLPPWVIK